MARTPKKTGTELVDYDAELAQYASKAATLTNSTGGGKFFSMQAGVLKFDDVPLPGNQMAVIVAAHALENVYYDQDFTPGTVVPPKCFAFCKDADDIADMAPHARVDEDDYFERQDDKCAGCWANEFGSASKGKGKACSNRRRLALLPAGTYDKAGNLELYDDVDHFSGCEEAYLKVPVMSGKLFDNYLKEVADQLNKPLFAVYTRVYLEPDARSQFAVKFELIEPVEDREVIRSLIERHKKLHEAIDFPYNPPSEEDEKPKPKAAANKKLTGGARKR
jgi:hypothetical protein